MILLVKAHTTKQRKKKKTNLPMNEATLDGMNNNVKKSHMKDKSNTSTSRCVQNDDEATHHQLFPNSFTVTMCDPVTTIQIRRNEYEDKPPVMTFGWEDFPLVMSSTYQIFVVQASNIINDDDDDDNDDYHHYTTNVEDGNCHFLPATVTKEDGTPVRSILRKKTKKKKLNSTVQNPTKSVYRDEHRRPKHETVVRFDAVHVREHSLTTILPVPVSVPTTTTEIEEEDEDDEERQECVDTSKSTNGGGYCDDSDSVRLPVMLDWSHARHTKSISVDDYELIRERRHGWLERGQLSRLPYERRKYLLERVSVLTSHDLQQAEQAWNMVEKDNNNNNNRKKKKRSHHEHHHIGRPISKTITHSPARGKRLGSIPIQ
jgi:hypothetical protein